MNDDLENLEIIPTVNLDIHLLLFILPRHFSSQKLNRFCAKCLVPFVQVVTKLQYVWRNCETCQGILKSFVYLSLPFK